MNIVRLQVLSKYQSRQVAYQAGTIIEVTEAEADFLFRDAPGCFEIAPDIPRVDVEPPADEPPVDEPPAGKAPRRPPLDKQVKDEDTEKK
jgi:hypothetical protein